MWLLCTGCKPSTRRSRARRAVSRQRAISTHAVHTRGADVCGIRARLGTVVATAAAYWTPRARGRREPTICHGRTTASISCASTGPRATARARGRGGCSCSALGGPLVGIAAWWFLAGAGALRGRDGARSPRRAPARRRLGARRLRLRRGAPPGDGLVEDHRASRRGRDRGGDERRRRARSWPGSTTPTPATRSSWPRRASRRPRARCKEIEVRLREARAGSRRACASSSRPASTASRRSTRRRPSATRWRRGSTPRAPR